MSPLHAAMTIRDVVVARPDSEQLLRRLGFDTCCGALETLEEQCRRRGLDPREVLAKLEADATDLAPAPCQTGCGEPSCKRSPALER